MQKVLVLMFAGVLAACSHTGETEGNRYITQTLQIEAVEGVIVEGPFQVYVFGNSDKAEVTLFGPPSQMADAVAEVVDGNLVIRFENDAKWSWNPGDGMHANIYLPALNTVAVSGPSRVNVSGVKTEKFSAGIGGAGSIRIERLQAATVELGIGGSGSIHVEGTADSAQMGIGGAGSIEAKRLRVKTAQIGIGGAGSVYADVSETAEIGIGGTGHVEVVGGAQCVFDESQADQIECR